VKNIATSFYAFNNKARSAVTNYSFKLNECKCRMYKMTSKLNGCFALDQVYTKSNQINLFCHF